SFDHCLMKVNEDVDTTVASFVDCIFNQDPLFFDPFEHDDYHLAEGSPCIDAGIANGITIDLDGKPRSDGKTDIGCYEF
ncbi:MAG: choice-of-anchor Q domain-containing protein, partial [Chitinophagales bacterium]